MTEKREGMSEADHLEYCRHLDARLCSVAKRRAELDVEEAGLLREAEEMKLWRVFGHLSLLDYMERAMGYQPHTARERLRVAKALAHLPLLTDALAAGRVPHSAVREVAGVVTAETENAWLDAIEGKSCREVEKLVAGHKPGDLPESPTDPDLRTHRLELVLGPEAFAAFRDGRVRIQKELGHQVSDDELIRIIFRRALDAPAAPGEVRPPAYVRSIKTCDQCRRHWEIGGGRDIEVSAATAAMADCDARLMGSLDATKPARITSTIPPRMRKQVLERDGHRCIVPGCRSAANIDIHHIHPRALGGGHTSSNMMAICDGHHGAVHHGLLSITGSAPHNLTFAHRRQPLINELIDLDPAPSAADSPLSAPSPQILPPTTSHDAPPAPPIIAPLVPRLRPPPARPSATSSSAARPISPPPSAIESRPTWDVVPAAAHEFTIPIDPPTPGLTNQADT